MLDVATGSGNFVLVSDDGAAEFLRHGDEMANDLLYEVTDAAAFHASDRLRIHAPGRIGHELVDVDLAHEFEPNVGAFEATAGVEPDLTEGTFGRGLGSDPADYPVYVDQGTGIFGERRTPIVTIPGNVMVIPPGGGYPRVFAHEVKGQPAQHFSEHAFDDTVAWMPARLEMAMQTIFRMHRAP